MFFMFIFFFIFIWLWFFFCIKCWDIVYLIWYIGKDFCFGVDYSCVYMFDEGEWFIMWGWVIY